MVDFMYGPIEDDDRRYDLEPLALDDEEDEDAFENDDGPYEDAGNDDYDDDYEDDYEGLGLAGWDDLRPFGSFDDGFGWDDPF